MFVTGLKKQCKTVVFEDDAIEIIASPIDIDMYEADMYLRAFAKRMMKRLWSL